MAYTLEPKGTEVGIASFDYAFVTHMPPGR